MKLSNISRSISNKIIRNICHKIYETPSALLRGGGAQSSAFDDIWGWWRADTYTGANPTIALTDLSGNSRTMTQQAGTLTPGTAANGQARMVGNAAAYLTSSATLNSWPVTIVSYGQRTDGTSQGFFGHTGASGFNTLWTGYESLNRQFILNTNGAENTNTATDGVWVARIGWGSRHAIINGISQSGNTLAQIARSSAIATTLGTQYRGLNYAFQETMVWDRVLSLAELDEVYTYLNTRYGASIPLQSSYTPAPTIIIIGDSNAAGRGDRGASDVNIPAEYLGAISGANVWANTGGSNSTGNAFESLSNTVAKTGFVGNHMFSDNTTRPSGYVGCESALCKEYLDSHGGDVWLNKHGVGGSYLDYVAAQTFWHHSKGGLAQINGLRGIGIVGNEWWRSVAIHNATGRRPDIKGIIVFLGGNDASDVSGVASAAFQDNLTDFYPALRTELGFPSAKILQARWHSGSVEPFTSVIRSATNSVVAATANCQLIDMDGYELRGGVDTGHYSINGQIELGQDLAAML